MTQPKQKPNSILTWAAALLLSTFSVSAQELITGDLFGFSGRSIDSRVDLAEIRPSELVFVGQTCADHYTSIHLASTYSDIYRTGGMEQAGASFARSTDVSSIHGRRADSICWELTANLRTTRFHGDISPDDSDVDLELDNEESSGSLEARAQWKSLYLYGSLGWLGDGDPQPGVGIRLDPIQHVSVGGVWRRHGFNLDATGLYENEPADVVVDVTSEDSRIWARVEALPWLSVEGTATRRLWIAGYKQGLTPTLLPWGDELALEGLIHLRHDPVVLSLGMRSRELDAQVYGHKGVYPFAKITALEFELHSYLMQIDYQPDANTSRYIVDAEIGSLSAFTRGHVEFWPWTEGWVDYLGLRRYFIGEGEASFQRIHARWQRQVSSALDLHVGAHGFHVTPEGDFEHWRPAFFVFGKEDEQHYSVNVERATFGQVDLGITYRHNTWELGYSFNQLFPIQVTYATEEGEGKPSGESGGGSRSATYGGGTHSLTLNYFFE
jgi:hypothetical protein